MRPDAQSAGHAKHFQYRPAVDGLRGVAVLAVLGFHAFPETVSGGYVGVDVFFVISGFLITGIIARQMMHGDFSFADFYWRRVRRLFPALVLVLATTLALGWFLLLPDEFKQLGKHASAAAAFLANFALWRESGYFDTAAELKPLLHLWSLGIEEQFYLVWPAVLVAFWKRRTTLLVILSTLVIASFALSVNLARSAPIANFYWPVSRFWELGAGCLLALLMERRSYALEATDQRGVIGNNLLPLAGLALILASIVAFDTTTAFPGWAAVLPVAGTLLILATPENASLQRNFLGSRPLVYAGLISYALYLWHWPLLSFLNILEGGSPPLAIRWAALALSFVLAGLTYRYLELPIRRHKDLRFNIGLAGSAAAAGVAGMIVYATGGVAQRFDADVQALRHGPRRDELCYEQFAATAPINYCRATSAQSPSILFVGDSRAHAIYESAAPLLAPDHSVMLLGRGGCPPLLNVRISGYDPNEAECEQVWNTFVRYVHQTKPKVVVVVGNGSFLITRPKVRLIRQGATAPESKEAIFEYGIRSLLSALTEFSQVIYLGEIPAFSTAPSCFLRAVRLPTTACYPERDRDQVEFAMAPYNRVLDRVQTAFPEVQLVDAVAVLCAADVCSQRPPGKPLLYSDAIHLSPAGARLLVEDTDLPKLISRDLVSVDTG
jgi:peptidoglycan/LPS O-acetylase OafA/YrhL